MPNEIDDILNILLGGKHKDATEADKEHLDAIKSDLQLLMSGNSKDVRKSIIADDFQNYMDRIRPHTYLWKLKKEDKDESFKSFCNWMYGALCGRFSWCLFIVC